MRNMFVLLSLLGTNHFVAAQQVSSPVPKPLPPIVDHPPIAPAINLVRFDPADLALARVDGHWQIAAGKKLLRDFGPFEREAHEALRLIRDMRFTRYGSIAGATPAFEFWLPDDVKNKGLVAKNVIPFNGKAVSAKQVAGAWIVCDDHQMLYNFGTQKEASLQALAIIKKFGFNELGVIGLPNPSMTYLSIDPYAKNMAPKTPDLKEIVNKLSEQGLLLPKIGYVGGRVAIEQRKLDVIRVQNKWVLVHGKDALARFGNDSIRARDALRILQDSRVSELCLIGNGGLPIFLSRGQAPRFAGLGFNNVGIQPAEMKVREIKNNWCITQNAFIVLEFGDNRADAELVRAVLQHFQFDEYCPVGEINNGGFRFFTKSK